MSRAKAAPAPGPTETMAARCAVIGGATDWIEAARRLSAAGYDDAGIRMALAEGADRDARLAAQQVPA